LTTHLFPVAYLYGMQCNSNKLNFMILKLFQLQIFYNICNKDHEWPTGKNLEGHLDLLQGTKLTFALIDW
jgi:hypothetical protein